MNNIIINYFGIGKRKESISFSKLVKGTGKIIINNQNYFDYFISLNELKKLILIPLNLLNILNIYDINIKVKGGGLVSQLKASVLSISKLLSKIDIVYKKKLNTFKLLKTDTRIKERRKYGLKKARKASQFSKR